MAKMCVDLRYFVLLIINFFKDSYPISTKTTNQYCLALAFLILFCTTSVKVTLGIPSPSTNLIRFETFQKFSYHMAVSVISSLLFPKDYFWIALPIILFCSFCSLPARLLSQLARSFSWILPVVYLDVNPTVMIRRQENLEEYQPQAEAVVVLDIYDHDEEEPIF